MKIFNELVPIHNLSLALGFFDGIHLGHSVVIKNAVDFASKNNIKSGVILFNNHPREFFTGTKIENILTFNDKASILSQMGIDYIFLLDFNIEIAQMTASEYLENVIMHYFKPKAISTGFNHTFGKSGLGDSCLLKDYAKNYAFKYFQIPPITTDNNIISSTTIRNAVKNSNFELAKKLLGYDFFIKSPVIHGRQIGRTINFPTANLIYPENIVQLETGVYLTKVTTNNKSYKGILNYGYRPTIDNTDKIPVPEVHLIDFSGNLYGHIIKVAFIEKIRDEQLFNSLSELKCQISKDYKFAQNYKNLNI